MARRRRAERWARRRAYRAQHVENILDLLEPDLQKRLNECRLLDLGCGLGTICVPAARLVRSVVAVDLSARYLDTCREWAAKEGLTNIGFRHISILDLDEGEFDVVICSDVVEHIEEQDTAVEVIARSLAPNGVYYLSTNNRWWPMEDHYGLPFLSYLPKKWSDRYVRLMGAGDAYDVYPLSLSALKALLKRHELTWSLVPPLRPHTLLYTMGKRLVEFSPVFWNVANAFQVVGTKEKGGSSSSTQLGHNLVTTS